MTNSRRRRSATIDRDGQTSPALVVLLSLILVAMIALVVVLATSGRDGSGGGRDEPKPERRIVEDGETVKREELADPPKPVGAVPAKDKDRIRETAQAGKTYVGIVKAGFDARVEDKDWGVRQITNLAYATEMIVNRTIESNDGRTIVELREFEKVRSTKLLCEVEGFSIELGLPGVVLLGFLDAYAPGSAGSVVAAQPIAEAILGRLAQRVSDDAASKAFAHVESLQGKQVRITFVDGQGVTAVAPVGCSLDAKEQDFVFRTAALADYWIMPDLKLPVGATWSVDGSQFGNFFDPSWNGTPSGTVTIVRDADDAGAGANLATLRVQSGVIEINATDRSMRRVGSFEPRGRMQYSIDQSFVRNATLEGHLQVEQVSKDHLLFEASFRTQPKLQIVYSCEMR